MHDGLNQKEPIRRGANEANSRRLGGWFRVRAMIALKRICRRASAAERFRGRVEPCLLEAAFQDVVPDEQCMRIVRTQHSGSQDATQAKAADNIAGSHRGGRDDDSRGPGGEVRLWRAEVGKPTA